MTKDSNLQSKVNEEDSYLRVERDQGEELTQKDLGVRETWSYTYVYIYFIFLLVFESFYFSFSQLTLSLLFISFSNLCVEFITSDTG